MATGRTVSASFVTESDRKTIEICESISKVVEGLITTKELKKDYKEQFGKVSYTRDAGAGRGAGKLQRDAICTRGRGGKAPFSNRNLRWHPLVVAEQEILHAKKIEKIKITGVGEAKVLVFVVKLSDGKLKGYPSDKTHELPERYVVLPEHWLPHIDELKNWSDVLWTTNSCIIPALEACEREDSIETYALLAISVAVQVYKIDFKNVYAKVLKILKNSKVGNIILPTKEFPKDRDDIMNCPMCKVSIVENAAKIVRRERSKLWQPSWRVNKRDEGEDSSIQIMHVKPLTEQIINHNARNARYGHRWCNVSMTDHSLSETLDFMEYIVRAHERCK